MDLLAILSHVTCTLKVVKATNTCPDTKFTIATEYIKGETSLVANYLTCLNKQGSSIVDITTWYNTRFLECTEDCYPLHGM